MSHKCSQPGHPIDSEQLLRGAGLRCTPGRVAILTILAQAGSPMSRAQIAKQLKSRDLDKVTIYRTLDRFIGAGIVHQAYLRHREAYFELADHCTAEQCHPHFECIRCGKTLCLYDMAVPKLSGPKDYVVRRQQVRLEGLCPQCR